MNELMTAERPHCSCCPQSLYTVVSGCIRIWHISIADATLGDGRLPPPPKALESIFILFFERSERERERGIVFHGMTQLQRQICRTTEGARAEFSRFFLVFFLYFYSCFVQFTTQSIALNTAAVSCAFKLTTKLKLKKDEQERKQEEEEEG